MDCAKKKNGAVIFILRVTGGTSFNVGLDAPSVEFVGGKERKEGLCSMTEETKCEVMLRVTCDRVKGPGVAPVSRGVSIRQHTSAYVSIRQHTSERLYHVRRYGCTAYTSAAVMLRVTCGRVKGPSVAPVSRSVSIREHA